MALEPVKRTYLRANAKKAFEANAQAFLYKLKEKIRSGKSMFSRIDMQYDQGTSKVVAKVWKREKDGSEKPYALSLVQQHPYMTAEGYNFQAVLRQMREVRDWYREHFGNWTQKEHIITAVSDNQVAIATQEWVEPARGYEDIFYDIPNNYKRIIKKAKKDSKFARAVKELAQRVLEVYNNTGLLPDVFNYMAGSGPNIIYTKAGKIVIIDLHTVFGLNNKSGTPAITPKDDKKLQKEISKALQVFRQLADI